MPPVAETDSDPGALPIWLATWELECCHDDFGVGDQWESTLVTFRGLAATTPGPVGWESDDEGFVTITGRVLKAVNHNDGEALVDVGPFRIGAMGVRTTGFVAGRVRLHFEGHGPWMSIEPGQILVSGVVRRIQRFPIIWRRVSGVQFEHAGHRPPVDISTTAERSHDDDLLVHLSLNRPARVEVEDH